MSIRSKIEALITAANSATGESAADLTEAVQDLVAGYGGDLPIQISKIAAGEWTQATTIRGNCNADVVHNLGRVPDFIVIKSNYPTFMPTLNGAYIQFLLHQTHERFYYCATRFDLANSCEGSTEAKTNVIKANLTIDADGNYETNSTLFNLVGPNMFRLRSGSANPIEAGMTFTWIAGCFA